MKGIAMGAADVVPGVSGGTIAFISGIYEELIQTINNLNIGALGVWKKEGFKVMWKQVNGSFLLALFSGIVFSILSLAKIIKWLLENEAIILWSFFFGLVIASIFLIGKSITKWSGSVFLFLMAGAVISYLVTILEPASSPDSFYYLFFCGFIAIIAMILPGVSGAFILVLLGAYSTAINTVNLFLESLYELSFDKFMEAALKFFSLVLGAILGIKTFSKILNWMFHNHKNLTLAILTGFMIGSLNKIWPWKQTLSWFENSHGDKQPLLQENISPLSYDGDPKLIWAASLMIVGFLTIYLLERIAEKVKS
jgi:putative membrane protein